MRSILLSILEISIATSGIILVLFIFNALFFKKSPAKWRYYIWIMVVIALLIPFRPQFDLAVGKVEIPAVIEQSEPLASSDEIVQSGTQDATGQDDNSDLETKIPWGSILTIIWLAGVLVFWGGHILGYMRFKSTIKRWSTDVEDEEMLLQLQSVQIDLGIKSAPRLKRCNFISSPMLVGYKNPTILLPEHEIPADELELILNHEMVHYKRKDLWVRALVLLARAIHWFNPFVHLLAWALQSDCEASCDERVLSDTGFENRKLYGETIIGVLGTRNQMRTVFSTYFFGGKYDMKKRLSEIMNSKKKKIGVAVSCGIVVILAIVLSGSIFAQANDNRANNTPEAVTLTSGQAQEIALERTGGGKVIKCELDYDNGIRVYEIEVVNDDTKYDLKIGTANSEIYEFEQEKISTADSTFNSKTSSSNGSGNNTAITAARAKEIALGKTGGGTVTKCELDHDNGIQVYEIEIVKDDTKYEMKIGAANSEIYGYEQEKITAEDKTLSSSSNTPNSKNAGNTAITADKAREIALAKSGGGTVTKCELDYDDGVQVYEIEIVNNNIEYDFEINAANGNIIKFDKDIDDDDNYDDHDDD